MIRPGPPWIERNAYPGGIVVHVYTATVPPRRLLVTNLGADDPLEELAYRDSALVAAAAHGAPVVLVMYDGDTGERMRPTGVVQ